MNPLVKAIKARAKKAYVPKPVSQRKVNKERQESLRVKSKEEQSLAAYDEAHRIKTPEEKQHEALIDLLTTRMYNELVPASNFVVLPSHLDSKNHKYPELWNRIAAELVREQGDVSREDVERRYKKEMPHTSRTKVF